MTVNITSISYHRTYIEVVLEGTSTGFSTRYVTIHEQAFVAAEEHDCCRILINASRIDYEPDAVLEHNTAIDLAHRCHDSHRVAVILPFSGQKAGGKFESTAHSRGLSVRAFAHHGTAVSWLLS
jgi:hypothetical protein